MFSLFKSDPVKRLKKQHAMLLERAMHAQRKGDIRAYSLLTAEAEDVFRQMQDISSAKS